VITREAAGELRTWLGGRPRGWGLETTSSQIVGQELEEGWRAWSENHAWRGPCALFLDSLRRTYDLAREGAGSARSMLAEELEHWLAEEDPHGPPWDGEPLSAGPRLPSREAVAEHAIANLQHDEAVLVHGYSETVILALAAAQDSGLRPRVTVGAGAPDQSGKRLARELAGLGLYARVVWDAVALGSAPDADRIWLGTEALGPESFLGLVGTRLLLEEAARAEVPVELLCTSDKWVPGGHLELPAWGDEEPWALWSHAPGEVMLDSQPFEAIGCELVEAWITERGREPLAEFSLRSLRVGTASPCGDR
jgi:hypothetical protein